MQALKQASRCLQCAAIAPRNATLRASSRSFVTSTAAEIQARSTRPTISSLGSTCRATGLPRRTYATISAAELEFGQPVHETHPHLLREGESMYHTCGLSTKALLIGSCQSLQESRHKNTRIEDRNLPRASLQMV